MQEILGELLNLPGYALYFIVFGVLIICGLGLPIPEDITLILAGVLCYYEKTSLELMIIVGMVGVMLGDSIIFLMGAKFGPVLTRKWPFKKILNADRLEWASEKLRNKGNRLIFAARFMPGLRAPIFFTAATLGLPYRTFLFYDGLAAILSVPAIIMVSNHFGDQLDKVIQLIRTTEHGILIVILVTVLVFFLKWYIGKRKESVSKSS